MNTITKIMQLAPKFGLSADCDVQLICSSTSDCNHCPSSLFSYLSGNADLINWCELNSWAKDGALYYLFKEEQLDPCQCLHFLICMYIISDTVGRKFSCWGDLDEFIPVLFRPEFSKCSKRTLLLELYLGGD